MAFIPLPLTLFIFISHHFVSVFRSDWDSQDSQFAQEVSKAATLSSNAESKWTLECSSEEEWASLADSLRNSRDANDKSLLSVLVERFLDTIPGMIEAKVSNQCNHDPVRLRNHHNHCRVQCHLAVAVMSIINHHRHHHPNRFTVIVIITITVGIIEIIMITAVRHDQSGPCQLSDKVNGSSPHQA